ncbi:hypothetical protein FNV43_RR01042 [Rhamnella rubrinervis]|uniref:Pentatricopeptide repeat-containing protein n=1 Tax=Rhamnella rubrinervis TaxID=2594499 RepID=A0A8K0HNW8_9ROSA|nr:hypothetical protein FNV43_RR01042 [Rhamnella rubrinervis]
MILTGFIKDTFAAKKLLQLSTNDLDYSYRIFNVIENPDASICNIMMMAYVRRNYPHRAIPFYKLMLYRNVGPNLYTYPFLVEACAIRNSKLEGKQMHNHVLKLGFDSDVDVRSTFVDMYADCLDIFSAEKVFGEGPIMDSFVWYSLLKVEAFNECWGAMQYFCNMMPEKDMTASNFLIVCFCRYGMSEKTNQLINEIPEDDTVSWSNLIDCFCSEYRQMYGEALDLFICMHANGIRIDEFVVESVLLCCLDFASLGDIKIIGKLIHSLVVKIGIECDVELQNSLICMYSTCGQILSAQNLFNAACWLDRRSWRYMLRGYVECSLDENVKALFKSMPQKVRSSCIAIMISHYSQHDCFSESLALFQEMVRSGISRGDQTWYDIIMRLPHGFAALDLGKCIHAHLIKNGYKLKNSSACSALSHMYGMQTDERGFK